MTQTSQLFDDPDDTYTLPTNMVYIGLEQFHKDSRKQAQELTIDREDTDAEPVQTQELDFDQANYWGMGGSDDE